MGRREVCSCSVYARGRALGGECCEACDEGRVAAGGWAAKWRRDSARCPMKATESSVNLRVSRSSVPIEELLFYNGDPFAGVERGEDAFASASCV